MSDLTITEVEAFPLRAELITPFRFAHIVRTTSQNVLLKITTTGGHVGWGEACPVPQLTAETQASIVSMIDGEIGPNLLGRDATERSEILAGIRAVHVGIDFTLAALDVALWDLAGRASGRSIADLIGGRQRATVEVHGSVGWSADPDEVRASAQRSAESFGWIKLYAGRGSLDEDLATIEAAREGAGPGHPFLLDINGLWTLNDVARAAPRLAAAGVELIEQPLPPWDHAGNAAATSILLEGHGIAVAADESIRQPADVVPVATARAASVVNVGLSKLGGITRALEAAQVARAHGLEVMVGGVVELGVANAAGIQLAAALPELAAPSYLMGPLKYVRQVTSPVIDPQRSKLAVPTGAGLGLTIDEGAIGALDARAAQGGN